MTHGGSYQQLQSRNDSVGGKNAQSPNRVHKHAMSKNWARRPIGPTGWVWKHWGSLGAPDWCKGCNGDRSDGDGDMDVPAWDIGPGGHRGEQPAMGGIEHDWKCKNDVEGVRYNGRWCWMGDAMSAACHNLKQVETNVLAGYWANQHRWCKCSMNDIPEPSNPIPITTDDLTHILTHHAVEDDSNCDLEASVPARWLTRSYGHVKAESGKSDAPDMLYMDHRWCRSDSRARYVKTRPLELIEDEHAHPESATT